MKGTHGKVVYFEWWSQEGQESILREGEAAGRQAGMVAGAQLRDHTPNKHRVGKGYILPKPVPTDACPTARPYLLTSTPSPQKNCETNLKPSIQTPEPMGSYFIQTTASSLFLSMLLKVRNKIL